MTELSPEARALLARVGDGDGPNAVRRARVKRQLAARLAAAGVGLGAAKVAAAAGGKGVLVGATAAVGTAGVSMASVASWLAGGILLGSLVMVPVGLLQEPMKAHATPSLASSQQAALRPSQRLPAGVGAPLVERPETGDTRSEATVERGRPPNRDGSGGSSRVSPSTADEVATTPASASLGSEMRLLESAQKALAAGQGERALELLLRHEREFPAAALAEERLFARVIALCQLGRSAEARAAAEAFLRAAPRSPLVPRLRKSCALRDETAEGVGK